MGLKMIVDVVVWGVELDWGFFGVSFEDLVFEDGVWGVVFGVGFVCCFDIEVGDCLMFMVWGCGECGFWF